MSSFWSIATNLLFLYTGAVLHGDRDGNLAAVHDRQPALATLVLELASDDRLGDAARNGVPVRQVVDDYAERIAAVATADRNRPR